MKKLNLTTLLLAGTLISYSQIDVNNYATSYNHSKNIENSPFLVTAIPYNGIHYSAINFQKRISLNTEGEIRPDDFTELYTYDSGAVFFFAPGINRENVSAYEFRVLKNAKDTIQNWTTIKGFTYDSVKINLFQSPYGFLGKYNTTWGNFILVDLRKKDTKKIISSSLVYWKQTRPEILNIYTANRLNDFLKTLKDPYRRELDSSEVNYWRHSYPASELDSSTDLPKHLRLASNENNVIFYIKEDIYSRFALEYRLVLGNYVLIDWRPNKFDNNFIWLDHLSPGNYKLEVRFKAQSQNVLTYPFSVVPAWFQTLLFRLFLSLLILIALLFIFMFIRILIKNRKLAAEKRKKEFIENKLMALRSQLNPHFIFNSLNSIQNLVNKSDIEKSNHYLSEFSSLLRETLLVTGVSSISVSSLTQM